MQLADNIKPLSYLENHATEVARQLGEGRESLVITTDGEPAFVCMSIKEFDEMKETISLLKLLNMDQADAGRDFNAAMAEMEQTIFG